MMTRMNTMDARIETRMNIVENNISHGNEKVDSIVRQSTLVDSAEMIFTSIPKSLTHDQNNIVTRLLTTLEHPELIGFVLEVREWTGPALGNPTIQSNDPASSALPAQLIPHTAIVLKLSSTTVRDSLVFNSAKFKNETAQDIFGVGGRLKVFWRPLWPKEVHLLLRKA
ncbi:hypothetical protein QAD02_002835 [Eretmocerus hayati]|uniref:Uncharacterized protein n=1 Tax=Eretmocerus hayati TaxID=131215 RepID=A0ACC2NLS8_9HYME|nr:hypothetical protein QAD02_002835 [Eretmocerus hayati]